MIIDQKKIAQVILQRRKKDGTEQSAAMPSEEGFGPDQAGVEICGDILLAIEHKSKSELWQAIQAAVQAATDMDEDTEQSEPAMDGDE